MANTVEIIIKATDKASEVVTKINAKVVSSSKEISAGFDGVGNSIKNLVSKLGGIDKIADKMGDVGKKMSIGVTLPLVAVGVAATKAASDLGETANKVDVLFGKEGKAIKDFAATADKALGQSKKTAMDAASTFAIFGKSAGLAGKELTDFAIQNTQLASDMASFFNTSPEDAITAIGAAFRGETEPIRRYGVLLDDASLRQEALKQGLISTTKDALTPQQKVLAAQALILKQTSAAQGDFARTSTGLANATRITNAQLQNALATLGENLLPIVNEAVVSVNRLLEAFNGLTPEQQKLIIGFAGVAAAIGPVLTVGSKLVGVVDLLGKGVGLLGTSAGPLALVVTGLVAIIAYLNQVGEAAKKSNDELMAMSRSGDLFQQAAASTEILLHGQDRLKDALDGVNKQLAKSDRSYSDYKSSLEATAKAAGFQIDAEGNLYTLVQEGLFQRKRVIEANFLLSESERNAAQSADELAAAQANAATTMDAADRAARRLAEGQAGLAQSSTDLLPAMIQQGQAVLTSGQNTAKAVEEQAAVFARGKQIQEKFQEALGNTIEKNEALAKSLATSSQAEAKQQLAEATILGLKEAYEKRTLSAQDYEKAVQAVQLRYNLATPQSLAMAKAEQEVTQAFLDGKLPLEDYLASANLIPASAADGILSTQELARLGLRPLAGEFINTKKAVDDFLASLRSIPNTVSAPTSNITTPNTPRNPNVPGGYQQGGDFIVPSGFPRDTYRIGVSSGERVQVTPAGQRGGAGVSIGAVTVNVGGSNASANEIKEAVYEGIMEVFNGARTGAA